MSEQICPICGASFRDRGYGAVTCSRRCGRRSHAKSPQQRLEEYARRDDITGCLVWTGATSRSYGRITITTDDGVKRSVPVHRLAWEFANGPIPPGQCVLHRCDNPPCFELSHLFLGTISENNMDRAAKGRTSRRTGEANPLAKLTAAQVVKIYRDVRPYPKIAADYGICVQHVCDIKLGHRWQSVTKDLRADDDTRIDLLELAARSVA